MRKLSGKDGVHRLLTHYQYLENRQGKSRLSTAKLLLKIARRMVLNERIYLPDEWVNQPAPSEDLLFEFLDCVNKSLHEKWKSYDLSGIEENSNYLIKWKEYCNDLKSSSSKQSGVSAPK